MWYFILIHFFKITLPLGFEIQTVRAFLSYSHSLFEDYILSVIFTSVLFLNSISSKVKSKADITVGLNN